MFVLSTLLPFDGHPGYMFGFKVWYGIDFKGHTTHFFLRAILKSISVLKHLVEIS